MRKGTWVNALVLVAIAVIFGISMMIAPRPATDDEEAFGGTDAAVTAQLEEAGHEPWFTPIFEPGSGEIESGLFALQAGLGGAVLGYALGNLRGRKSARDELSTPVSDA